MTAIVRYGSLRTKALLLHNCRGQRGRPYNPILAMPFGTSLGLSTAHSLIEMIPVAHHGLSLVPVQTSVYDNVPPVYAMLTYVSSSVIMRASVLLSCRDGADAA